MYMYTVLNTQSIYTLIVCICMYKPYIFSSKSFPNNNPRHFLKAPTLESIASSRPHAIFFFSGKRRFLSYVFPIFPTQFETRQEWLTEHKNNWAATTHVRAQLFSGDSLRPLDCSPQAPLSMGFPKQGYWSDLPFPSPRGHYIYESRLSCIIYHKESLQIIHCLMLANPL